MAEKHPITGDPRVNGFNYGAPLPIVPGDPLYHDAERLSDRLLHIKREASQRAWRLDMALRDYRHACTVDERAKAGEVLGTVYRDLVKFSPLDMGPADTGNYSFEQLSALGDRPMHKGYSPDYRPCNA
jgi:hypothetical protein